MTDDTEHETSLDLLRRMRQELGARQVAADLECSESAIRGVCAGCYPGTTDNILAKAERRYRGVVQCPFVGETVTLESCRNRAYSPRPFGGNLRERWWAACQACPLKPNPPTEAKDG
jgi:hypothetical protein